MRPRLVGRGRIQWKLLVLPGGGARGQQRLAVHIQHVSGIARQARTRLEEMPHDVGCDHHHRRILERDGTHLGGLVAVHPGLTAELAGLNRRDLVDFVVLDHLQRDGA